MPSGNDNLRYRNDKPLAELIEQFIQDAGIKPKLSQAYVRQNWAAIAGKPIADRTDELLIKDGVLILRIDRPALRQEVLYLKSKLIERVNQSVGYELITNIRAA